MIIYLDSDFRCYTDYADGRQTVETDFFDGKSREYIEGYRYVPDGQTWTRSDGTQFTGLMVAPAIDYKQIMTNVAVSYLDDDQAESVTILFPNWEVGVAYAVGDRRQYDGLLYRCVQAHTSQADWYPPAVPALWVRTSTEEWPEWIQPTGAHDAYNKGDKVSHNARHWVSNIDANVYEPGVYGWDEVTE
jgi:hypothetical protein